MIIKFNNDESKMRASTSLSEASRRELVSKSRTGSKSRYLKRLNYQVSNFKGVDLQQLFENDYMIYTTPINEYLVTIAFPGVLTELRNIVKSTQGDPNRINYQMVLKALRIAFDKTDDVKVRCSCKDFLYRFMYYANKYGYLYGPLVSGTEKPPKITNPNNSLGATCKHLDLFLSNKRWLIKAASVINALIRTYPEKASIYLYDEEELVDFEDDELSEDEVTTEEDEESPEYSDNENNEEI